MNRNVIFCIGISICLLSGCVYWPIPHSTINTYQFQGTVVDKNKRPIENVRVFVSDLPKTSVSTDSEGYFLTTPSRSYHCFAIYTYDGIEQHFPDRHITDGKLILQKPGYKELAIAIQQPPYIQLGSPRVGSIKLGTIYLKNE